MENTNIYTCVQFVKLVDDAVVPNRATLWSAGFDLYSTKNVTVVGGAGNMIVPTGISVRLPPGTYARIAMRSGLARDQHLTVSAGVIDRDYMGEIKVLVSCTKTITKHDNNKSYGCFGAPEINTSDGRYTIQPHIYTIKKGEKFAQLVIERIDESVGELTTLSVHNTVLPPHEGFGSTGKT